MVGASGSGSLGFACYQRLGCHLENTCIQNVAWILADFQKFVNNAFCLFSCREEINAGTLKWMGGDWSGGVEKKA